MNDEMYLVIVDTRGMSPSQIDGYEEHTCSTQEYFDEHVIDNPNLRCIKSKVAKLCGLDMKIYFHEYVVSHDRVLEEPPELAIEHEREDFYPLNHTNRGATLLTFDPRTGFPEYKILGKAYVVVNSGDYPLSNHQVWGMHALITEARDLYHCDPDHMHRGRRQLLRWCHEYREQKWGPMTIYEPRFTDSYKVFNSLSTQNVYVKGKGGDNCATKEERANEQHEYYRHRHFPDCACKQCIHFRGGYGDENENKERPHLSGKKTEHRVKVLRRFFP